MKFWAKHQDWAPPSASLLYTSLLPITLCEFIILLALISVQISSNLLKLCHQIKRSVSKCGWDLLILSTQEYYECIQGAQQSTTEYTAYLPFEHLFFYLDYQTIFSHCKLHQVSLCHFKPVSECLLPTSCKFSHAVLQLIADQTFYKCINLIVFLLLKA